MTRTQIRVPEPLYQRLKEIADQQNWSFSEVMRHAAENYVSRFPAEAKIHAKWEFPTLDCGGDYLVDPAEWNEEAQALSSRSSR